MGNQVSSKSSNDSDLDMSEMSQQELIDSIKVNLPKVEHHTGGKDDSAISSGNMINVGGSCMKEKIDNLIEGYLLNADFNSETDDLMSKISSKGKATIKCKENGAINVDMNNKLENHSGPDRIGENLLHEIQKKKVSDSGDASKFTSKLCPSVDDSGDVSNKTNSTVNDSPSDNLTNDSDTATQKEDILSDDVSEKVSKGDNPVNTADNTVREQKKKVRTFQCLIEEVLDSSVGNKDFNPESKTHILELCDKTERNCDSEKSNQGMEPQDRVSPPSDNKTPGSGGGIMLSESVETNDKQKNSASDDMSLSKKKVMYLKDHIEKVLERSFPGNSGKKHGSEYSGEQTNMHEPQKSAKSMMTLQDHYKKMVDEQLVKENMFKTETKSEDSKMPMYSASGAQGRDSRSNSFSAQSIVNNTMDQSKVINNLLSPATQGESVKETSPQSGENTLLQKSSVETIMDNIIKNAVNETFGDGKSSNNNSKEGVRKSLHNVIHNSCTSPGPPRLEKYDSKDMPHYPKFQQPDKFFMDSHEQLLRQQQSSQKNLVAGSLNHLKCKSPNPTGASFKESNQGYASHGMGKPSDINQGLNSKSSYSPQQKLIPSPKRFQQHSPSGSSLAASYKSSSAPDHPHHHHHQHQHHHHHQQHQQHHPHVLHSEYSPQHVGHQISVRDCQCVSCEQNVDSPHRCPKSNPHNSTYSKQFDSNTKSGTHHADTMQSSLHGSRHSPYQVPNHGRIYRSNKNMEEVHVNPGVSSAMALGPSPPLRYYQQNSPFRMPQLYPSNPPIPSPREYSRSNLAATTNPHGFNVHMPVPVHPQKGQEIRPGAVIPSSKPISPKLLRPPLPSPVLPQTSRMETGRPHHNPQRTKPESVQNYPSLPAQPAQHFNKGIETTSPPVLDLTLKKHSSGIAPPTQSGEQPLDLTCKKPKYSETMSAAYSSGTMYPHDSRTLYPIPHDSRTSPYPGHQESRHQVMSKSMHINNLKHSVDKYCHDGKYPPHQQKQEMAPRTASRPSSKEGYQPQFKTPVHNSDIYPSAVGGNGQRYPVPMYGSQGHPYQNTMTQQHTMPNMESVPDKVSRQLPQSAQNHQQISPYNHALSSHQQVSPQQMPKQSSQQAMMSQQSISSQARPAQQSARQESPELLSDHARQSSSRRSANVSKHEPIQNIIGNHSPNDILYLICRLCGQTYGSPYGFRKHFRNQHGFEPRAEHTIVQTISATKAMRDPPLGPPYNVKAPTPIQQSSPQIAQHFMTTENQKPFIQEPPVPAMQQPVVSHDHLKPNLHSPHNVNANDSVPKMGIGPESPYDTIERGKSRKEEVHNSQEVKLCENPTEKDGKTIQEDKDRKTGNLPVESSGERKFLECHECGQTFQLNDFGSYKRHCKQHVHPRMTDPFNPTTDSPSFQSQNFDPNRGPTNYPQGPAGPKYSSQNSRPSSQDSSSNCSAMSDHFSCKFCKMSFTYESALEEHLQTIHSNKEKKFACVMCNTTFNLYYDYTQHMAKMHYITVPNSSVLPCPETIAAEQIGVDTKITDKKVAEKTTSPEDSDNMINKFRVIPSCHVTRMSADTAVTTASPDSSSDPVVSSANQVDNCISSTSLKSNNSASSLTSEYCIDLNKSDSLDSAGSPGIMKSSLSRQVSCDSGSTSENIEEYSETKYMHKKFGSKRKNSANPGSESSAGKYGKFDGIKSPGNASKSPGSVNSPSANSCASHDSESSSQQEFNPLSNKGLGKDSAEDVVDGMDGNLDKHSRIVLKIKCGSNGGSSGDNSPSGANKGEARHQLPFVWDRVTRSQTGRSVKPPKYH